MTINISTVKQKPFVTFINLLGHRGNKVSFSQHIFYTNNHCYDCCRVCTCSC